MSDVIVSTTESTTNVTTTNDVTTIAITDTVVEVSQATAGLQGPPGSNSDPTYVFVTNRTGAQLNKGAIVYVSGANGTHTQVSLALATGDTTSARTLGWLSEDIANNATGLCMVEGYLDGVNTQGVTEGAQLYLSPTVAGGFTETKPQAPDHLVYVGVCAKASSGNGRVFVKVQNGYEIDELHNVKITSPTTNDLLRYVSGTALWVNTPATAITVGSAVLSGTASYATNAGTSVFATTSGTSVYSAQSGTASYATNAGSATNAATATYAVTSGTSVTISGSITKSQVSDFTSGTVTSASTAQQAGTAVFASTASTATYATTSGTAVTISGTITTSQVSDFASGTVANISGTVTQSQVSNLTTDLAGKANLVGGNSFTGAQIITASTATQIPVQVRAAASPSVNVQEWDNSAGAVQASIDSNFRGNFPRVTAGSTADLGYAILSVNTGATANKGLVVRAVLSQASNMSEWQDSNGNALTRISPTGQFASGANAAIGQTGIDTTTMLRITSTGTALSGVVIRGAASQSANLQEWQDSAGATAARVNSTGSIITSQGFAVLGGASISGSIATLLQTSNAARIPLVVQGFTSQTANLQEWQTSTGSTALWVNSAGNLNSGVFILGTQNSGAQLTMVRGTAAVTNPGNNLARIYFRDGTNAGTLKLVVRAGTAGAETTVLDNIPQS